MLFRSLQRRRRWWADGAGVEQIHLGSDASCWRRRCPPSSGTLPARSRTRTRKQRTLGGHTHASSTWTPVSAATVAAFSTPRILLYSWISPATNAHSNGLHHARRFSLGMRSTRTWRGVRTWQPRRGLGTAPVARVLRHYNS